MANLPPSRQPRPARRRRLLLWLTLTPLTLLIVGCPFSYYLYQRILHSDAVRVACEWASLAPLPVPLSETKVEVLGSVFTREFRITFTTDAATLQKWLAASPGTSEATPEESRGVRTYHIKPGGGAEFSEVEVDDATGRVTIRTYWS